ncbi:unnamed protein product [Soboliphyme baturini]|uniref:Ion_trans_2 domain-containing protein n=1 Tax=Soboliphyme baturini TaxID=241478 RepID=A0A183J2B8_9BILA|nr:unnamed protein product [Soboliphyme baturini]
MRTFGISGEQILRDGPTRGQRSACQHLRKAAQLVFNVLNLSLIPPRRGCNQIEYAKLILPHVGLIMLSCLYAIGGAVVFYYIEKPNEKSIRQLGLAAINYQRDVFLERLWNMSLNGLNHTTDYDFELQNVTKTLFDAFDTHYISAQHLMTNVTIGEVWSFTSSLFFTTTLLTTIGKNVFYIWVH